MAIIDKPSDYFETVIYAGGTTDISSLDFQPDWVWAKKRTGAENHGLFDSIRGATKTLNSNTTAAESTRSGSLTSFDSDGFTMGGSDGIISASGNNYVAWSWKAGTSFTNDASATGIGSIDSTGSFNNDSGFSIVSYTGTGSAGSIKHGMNIAPKMVIVKSRSGTGEWITWHTGINIQAKLSLNTTDAIYNPGSGIYWNSTLPTSSVFSVGTSGSVSGNGTTYIAYCFADVQGYSKFGSYAPNGNADGNFIYTGMSPAFVMIKNTNTTRDWVMYDNKRPIPNSASKVLEANTSDAESTLDLDIDLLSNGFKLRGAAGNINTSDGVNYIYMAFAENPFVASNFVPATAR